MNVYYIKIKPKPASNKKGKGLPPHLKPKPQKKTEMLEWISSWKIWTPIKILCG
jgi:hypothetical protein